MEKLQKWNRSALSFIAAAPAGDFQVTKHKKSSNKEFYCCDDRHPSKHKECFGYDDVQLL